jgi:hypothetical protein
MLWIWMSIVPTVMKTSATRRLKFNNAFLSVAEDNGIFALSPGNVKVLFDSGGKDSFPSSLGLASQEQPFGLIY